MSSPHAATSGPRRDTWLQIARFSPSHRQTLKRAFRPGSKPSLTCADGPGRPPYTLTVQLDRDVAPFGLSQRSAARRGQILPCEALHSGSRWPRLSSWPSHRVGRPNARKTSTTACKIMNSITSDSRSTGTPSAYLTLRISTTATATRLAEPVWGDINIGDPSLFVESIPQLMRPFR